MTRNDLLRAGKLAVFALIAWATPPRWWRKAAVAMPTAERIDAGPARHIVELILGPAFGTDALSVLDSRRRACRREAQLQILGLTGPRRSWHPNIRLHGDAHLRRALDAGRGAILWVTDSAYSTLIFKMALDRAGYRAHQLSRKQHGFSASPFGIRFLNPLWCRVENRFIAERVFIRGDDTAPAMAILRTRLASNRCVIITVGGLAHRFAEVPFSNYRIQVPTGPIRFAQSTGAALLPAFAFQAGDGAFDVTIEKALPRANKSGPFDRVAAAYAKRLEPYVKKYPEQWTGWNYLVPAEISGATG